MHKQTLPDSADGATTLACGAWLKNTACLLQGTEVIWSPLHGDLGDPQGCRDLDDSLENLLARVDGTLRAIAHDLHPDFYSSQLAVGLAERLGVPSLAVQHHHAHIAALMAEHDLHQPVLGLALDGVGLGTDSTSWGGELLWVGQTAWQRLGHLLPLALPGGDIAAREPWRLVAAALQVLGREDEIVPRLSPLVGEQSARTVAILLQRQLNCPLSTGAGRWFDAAAGILGLSVRQQVEAEAAIALERTATLWLQDHQAPEVDGLWQIREDGMLDLRPLLVRLFELADADQAGQGAAVFHLALAAALADWVVQQSTELAVALGGGCFANRLLSSHLSQALHAQDIKVYTAQSVTCGDAGLALGQAWIARHWPDLTASVALPLEEKLTCA
ncbi:carbamoyltransferase HypF [Pseudomonas sp. Pseusp122]|uniref:Kae1-like domain-containing protein n=1 Tax=unclassified Pseudomonas TaxID=196821 RepID=UPI0039A54BC8